MPHKPIVGRKFGADDIRSFLAGIAGNHRDLGAGRQPWRRGAPFQCIGLNGDTVYRQRSGRQCGEQQGRDDS